MTATVEVVDDVWGQVVGALGGFAAATIGAIGIWIKTRGDSTHKRIETTGAAQVAQIEADSSERIHITEVLMARVKALEDHNAMQDERIANLVERNAGLHAQNTLLAEQNKLLKRQISALEVEKRALSEEVAILRDVVQGPISDALETLELDGDDYA